MTLWVFGDSYVSQSDADIEKFKHNHWIYFLNKELNCSEIELRGCPGAPNEWIYYQFYSCLPLIKSDDYVVFVSSQMNRRWFFLDDIGSSNYHISTTAMNNISSEEKTALKYYATYLDNPMMSRVFFENMCNSLHYQTIKNNLNLIILPGFESGNDGFPINGKYAVDGNLFYIGMQEIKGKTIEGWQNFIGNTHKGQDPRNGHLSYENHVILSKKIANTFLKSETLNLTQGFKEDFL